MDAKTPGRNAGNAAEKLLDNPGLTVERLPMLPVIFDKFAASCAEGMRPYSPAILSFFVNSINTDHVWDALDSYDGSIAAILYSPELDARVLVGLDRRCMFSLMEVLLGGDAQEPPHDDDRNYSTLETRVAQTVFEIAAEALHSAFNPVIATSFRLERVETRMDFTVMGRRNVLAVIAKILIQSMDIGGQMFVVIPQPALNSDPPAIGPRPLQRRLRQRSALAEAHAAGRAKGRSQGGRHPRRADVDPWRHLRLARRRHHPAQSLRRVESAARLQEPAAVLVRARAGERSLHFEGGRSRQYRGNAARAIPATGGRRRKLMKSWPKPSTKSEDENV